MEAIKANAANAAAIEGVRKILHRPELSLNTVAEMNYCQSSAYDYPGWTYGSFW